MVCQVAGWMFNTGKVERNRRMSCPIGTAVVPSRFSSRPSVALTPLHPYSHTSSQINGSRSQRLPDPPKRACNARKQPQQPRHRVPLRQHRAAPTGCGSRLPHSHHEVLEACLAELDVTWRVNWQRSGGLGDLQRHGIRSYQVASSYSHPT